MARTRSGSSMAEWLCAINAAGNWSGHAHVWRNGRALCGAVRTADEQWEPAPLPLMDWAKCEACARVERERDEG